MLCNEGIYLCILSRTKDWKGCKIRDRVKQLIIILLQAIIFARVLFSQISRVRNSRKYPLQFVSIYSNENISKITKLSPNEFLQLVKNHENNCTRKLWCIQYTWMNKWNKKNYSYRCRNQVSKGRHGSMIKIDTKTWLSASEIIFLCFGGYYLINVMT